MKIVIIGAMQKEIDMLVEHYQATRLEGKHNIYTATIGENIIYISKSGVGKVNAAINTQYLVDTYKPDMVINTGCAGSLIHSVKIMDTILSKEVTYHDFYPVELMQKHTPDHGSMKSDTKLLKKVEVILERLQMTYHVGTICSGDHFVTNDKQRDKIYEQTKALCVDMESASIAQVCRMNEIPFLVIRSISDFSDGVEEQELNASIKSSKIVIEFVKELIKSVQ